MQEHSKPAIKALFARSDADCICGIPLDPSHLAKTALIPLGLRAQNE
jgi:hypothetical protein